MTTYFVGGGFDCWSPDPAGLQDSFEAITIYSGGARADFIKADGTVAAPTSLWYHGYIAINTNYGGNPVLLSFRGADESERVRLRGQNGQWLVEFFDGANWQSSAQAPLPSSLGGTIDIHIVASAQGSATGKLELYYNSIGAASLTNVDTSGIGAMTHLYAYGYGAYNSSCTHSDTIVASYNTIGHTLRRRNIDGNGPEQQWAGDYTSINENGTNDSNAITADAVGETSTFTAPALSPTVAGSVIKCVAVGARLRSSGDVPAHIQAALTRNGADYLGPLRSGSNGYTPSVSCFDLDPSTGAPWASIDAANGNYGVKAVA